MRKNTIDKNNTAGLTVGPCGELARNFNAQLLEEEREAALAIINECYPEFGTTSDGTPTFAKAEGILIRLVHKDTMAIKEILLSLRIFQQRPNGEELAGNLLDVLTKQYPLSLKNWRVAMLDRASTNIKCINDVCEQISANVSRGPCNSHSLCKPGEAFHAPEANKFRETWNRAIVHGSTAAEECKKQFKVTPKPGGGIRWYIKFEQMTQLVLIGLERLMKLLVPVCLEKEWSKRSMVALAKHCKARTREATKAFTADGGNRRCRPTFLRVYLHFGRQGPLVLSAYLVFDRLDANIEQLESQSVEAMPLTTEACKQASESIQALIKPMEDDIASVDSELMVEFVSLQEARVDLDAERVALEKHQTGGRRVAPAGASRASSRNCTDRSYDLMCRGAEAEEDTEEAILNDSIRQLETVVNEIEQRRTRLKGKKRSLGKISLNLLKA
jgi:hypothetical protein